MTQTEPRVQAWTDPEPPTEATLRRRLEAEGLRPHRWSNGPGDVYNPHSHPYHKVIYVVRGAISFGLLERGQQLELGAGGRLDLPEGVVCLEAHRPA